MSEPEKVDSPENFPKHLGFMYGKISVPKYILTIWLSYSDFVREIEVLINKNITVDDESVYEVVKGIYFPLRRERELYGIDKDRAGALNHSKTRRGLRELCMALHGNPDYWETEYKDYLNSL